jgi:hypothetical protein
MHRMAPQPYPSMFLWPALAAQSASKFAVAVADELAELAELAEQISQPPAPTWTTPNRVALELPSMQLRDFSTESFDAHRVLLQIQPSVVTSAIVDSITTFDQGCYKRRGKG